MPINIKLTHYVLIVVFVQLKKIQFFNGIREYDKYSAKYLQASLKYLESEAKENQKDFNIKEWELVNEYVKTPVQSDSNSCAIHACMAADFISDNLPLSYTHNSPNNHFEYLRVKLCSDILRGYLDYPFITSPLNEIDLATYKDNYRAGPLPNKQAKKSSPSLKRKISTK